MNRRNIEEELEYIASCSDKNLRYLSEVEKLFDECINKGDFVSISNIDEFTHRQDFIMSAKFYKLQTISMIIGNELIIKECISFLNSNDNCESALNKLMVLTLMLRRIEMGLEEPYLSEAYDYIKMNHISVEAIAFALRRGCFEYEEKIVMSLFSLNYSNMNKSELLEWLFVMSEMYKQGQLPFQLALWLIEQGDYKNALAILNRIETKNDEVKGIIRTLNGVLNG